MNDAVIGFGFSAKRKRTNMASEEEAQAACAKLAGELLSAYTPEQLALIAAQHMIYVNALQQTSEAISKLNETRKELTEAQGESLQRLQFEHQFLVKNTAKIIRLALNEHSTYKARKSVGVKHDKPGASRDLKRKIQEVWATGKYASRDICAEEEWSGLGYGSFSAARKALRNTPDQT